MAAARRDPQNGCSTRGSGMRTYASLFAVLAMCSAAFIDSNVKASVRFIGRSALGVFTLLFLVSEAAAFFG
jgi:hypothetical protein